jgi:nucleosome assembly protein 1-like 1
VEKNEPKLSFFNFFTNLRMPSLDEMKNLDYEVEKELGLQLDTEYEIGIEIIDELIPYSMEYFVGVTHDADEFTEYMHERMIEQQEKGKKKKTKY